MSVLTCPVTFLQKNSKQKPTSVLKKSCLMKKKKITDSIAQSQKLDFSILFSIYNIINIDFTIFQNPVNHNFSFLQEIFKSYSISKVYRNKDRITLALKLCPKLSKTSMAQLDTQKDPCFLKEIQFGNLDFSSQNQSLATIFRKIHSILSDEQALKQNRLNDLTKEYIYLEEDQVTVRTEKIMMNRKNSKLIILQNVFNSNCKKIKNIHFTSELMKFLDQTSDNLVFDLLYHRSLPFSIFSEFDYKRFAKKSLEHFSSVLSSLFNRELHKTPIIEESFEMAAKIKTQKTKEQNVILKWTCSHPSIITIEICENHVGHKCQGPTPQSSQWQEIGGQLQNLKIGL